MGNGWLSWQGVRVRRFLRLFVPMPGVVILQNVQNNLLNNRWSLVPKGKYAEFLCLNRWLLRSSVSRYTTS